MAKKLGREFHLIEKSVEYLESWSLREGGGRGGGEGEEEGRKKKEGRRKEKEEGKKIRLRWLN